MASQFVHDPLYQFILPNESSREQVLVHFFASYLNMLYPYSDLLATSTQMEAVGLVFYSDRFKNTLTARAAYGTRMLKAIFTAMPICRYIGLKGFVRGLHTLNKASSAWLSLLEERPYMHLDMLVVQLPYRGQGIMSRFMQPLLRMSREEGLVMTLETQNARNLPIYEHYGLKVIHQYQINNSPLTQYGMSYDPSQLE